MQAWALARALNRRGLSGTVGVVVGAVISIVVIVAMAVPVSQSMVNNLTCGAETNLTRCSPATTGTLRTILDLLPLFFGLAALITVAALFS